MEFEISVTHLCIHSVSIFLNGAIFWTLVRKPLSRCPSNRFVLSLSTSHILVSLLTLLISLSWFIDTTVSLHMEQVNFYVTFGAGLVNSLTLTTIACERYITIARPMRYKTVVTTYRCSLIVIFLWALSTCITLIPLIVTDLNPHSSSSAAETSLGAPFFAIVFTTITLLCLSVMSICYYIIFTIAKEKCQHVQIGQFTASISSDWPSSAYPSQAEGQKPSSLLHHVLKANARNVHFNSNSFRSRLQQVEQIKQQQQRRSKPMQNSPRKTIATIIALLGSLVITQIPISFTLYSSHLWNISLIMLSISSITNPILYGFLNRKIRVQLWKTFRIQSKPKRPDCCFHNKQHSVYSDIIKDIVQESQIINNVPPGQHAKLPAPHSTDSLYGEKTMTDVTVTIGQDDNHNHELTQLPDTIQFPRKDSQDSGADMTFSDEEEEQNISTKEPSVFTICKKTNSRDDGDHDDGDDQPHQV